MKRIILYMLLIGGCLYAQVESSSGVSQFKQQAFFVDFANYIDSTPAKTRLDVFIQVPYSSIQFIKQNNNFNASYNLSLVFYDKDKKNLLFERIWKEKVSTDDFENTISKNNFNLSYKTFDFVPGEYFLTCILEDIDSRKSYSLDYKIKINPISDSLGLSDIIFVTDVIKDTSGEKIVPNVSKTVTNRTKSLPIYFEVYSDKERDVILEYILEDLKNNSSIEQSASYKIRKGTNSIFYTFENTNFKLGDYKLTINLKDNENNDLAFTEKRLYSIITGLPKSIDDLDKAI
ncbi:MAG: hypothetical protein QHH13_04160, partial [Melioribacter sp.]|nr:hypothetical protein [Melioribacter sp.]